MPHSDFRSVEKLMIGCHDFTAQTIKIILSTYDENLVAFVFNQEVRSVETPCKVFVNSVIYLSFTVTHCFNDEGKRLYACSV